MNHFFTYLKKTLFQGALKFLACVILLLFFSASLLAGNYTWNGTTNNNWGTASNWSGGVIPGTNDTITINSGKPNLELDQDRTVIQIIHNGSTIDLDTNELHITQRATFNGGDVIGESLKLRGALVFFQGTDFNCTLDVIVGQIKFSGGTFDQKGTFEQNGGASGWGEGGCVFNDSVTIKCSGATYLRMGQNTGDIFNAPTTFISTGVYSIQIAYGDTSFFNDNVFINCTGNGGLSFCSGSNAAAIIAPGKKITAGSSGLTAGVIHIKGIVQSDTTSQSIISTGTSTLNISSCNFAGNSTFSAPSILVKYSTFNSNSSFTKTGNAANQWEGGNVFYGTTTINNNTTGSGILRMALQAGDVYEPVNVNLGAYNIGKMFIKPFIKGDDLIANELQAVEDRSSALGLTPPLEVWLTEYNMNDDVSKNVGTWAHGLFNAIQTLKYLESPLITHLSSHAMTSDAVYGNIFESDRGFQNLMDGQLPDNVEVVGANNFATTQYGFTASGAAQNEIALAMKGSNVIAHRIDFTTNSTAIGNISYYDENGNFFTSSLLNLYGWSFEKEEGFEAIILNLGNIEYNLQTACSLGLFAASSNCPQSMVQLKAIDPTAGIGTIDLLPTGILLSERLYTTGEISIASPNQVSIPPHSLTRIIYRNPTTITVRLTDDEICAGTSTSALVQGANYNSTITLEVKQGAATVYSNSISDSLFNLPINLDPGTYTLFANDGSVTSDPVNLIIYPAMSVAASITSGEDIPCLADQDITLTADINTTSTDINNTYTYLWVPDKHILDNNPFQQSIVLDNENLTTQAYQVFVFDGQCWASSNLITFDRGPSSVDLGDDFTVCDNNLDFDLRAITTYAFVDNSLFHYRLLQDNTEISSGQLSDFNVPNPGVGNWTYRVEVWTDNGTISSEDCPVWDEVVVNIVECCSCSSAIALSPTPHGVDDEPINNYSDEGDLIDAAISVGTAQYSVDPIDGDGETVTITGNDPNYSICIDGELWIRNAVRVVDKLETLILQKCTLRLGEDGSIKVRGRAKLVLKGCVLQSCNGTTLWDGVYADITDQADKEPELEITDYGNNRTIILDAKNALVLRRDSPFEIEKCNFTNNYVDVLMEKYNKTNNMSTIYNCSFDFTAFNDPTFAPRKRAAFELNDIESFTIGLSANGSENIIENSRYGIYSKNSSFKLLNTEFHEIWDHLTTHVDGSCIASFSDFDFNDRLIEIGDGNASGENFFSNSLNGITGVGDMNYIIKKNTFGNINEVSESILKYCISLDNNNSLNKEIQINNNNKFYDYTFGIAIYNPLGKITIKGNDFSNGVYTDPPQGFEGTAINVNRITPAALWGSEISDNTIGETSDPGTVTPKQPRIGIRLSQINSVKVETNDIFFTHNSAPTAQHLGIWAENCSELRIADLNKIDNYFPNFQAVLGSMVTGLRLDASPFSCTEQNIFTRMSIGMHITGNSMFNSFYKNEFAEFDQGVFLDSDPFIGSSIGTEDPNNAGEGNVMRNKWTCNSCGSTTNNRITGSITDPLFWYHDASSTSNPEFPDNNVTNLSELQLTVQITDVSECLLPAFPQRKRNPIYL
jgi:hypothetical protein